MDIEGMEEKGKTVHAPVEEMKYSVLMSVYGKDNPLYLAQAIKSMLMQTVPPEQFVIVIDGPVLEELMRPIYEYQRHYVDFFTIVPLEHNGGLGNALNEGLKHCRNDLVARMDADDISLPERCEKELLEFKEHPDLAICGCNIDEFEEEPENVLTSRIVPSEYGQIRRFMRKRQPFNHATVIYRKTAVLKAGGYQPLKRKEDFDLFSRMLSAGDLAKNIDESLYLCRVGRDNCQRRKSWDNLKSAIYVYWRHLKRHGCSIADFCITCSAEILFFMMPSSAVKWFSDRFLRARAWNSSQ